MFLFIEWTLDVYRMYYVKRNVRRHRDWHCMFIACSLHAHCMFIGGVYEDVNPVVNSVIFIPLKYPSRHWLNALTQIPHNTWRPDGTGRGETTRQHLKKGPSNCLTCAVFILTPYLTNNEHKNTNEENRPSPYIIPRWEVGSWPGHREETGGRLSHGRRVPWECT